MAEQHRQWGLVQYFPGESPKNEFSGSAVTVGPHDKQARLQFSRSRVQQNFAWIAITGF